MQLARKNVTADPFVIYGFFDDLHEALTTYGLMDKPDHVWNLDETSFCMDPSKTKTMGPIGDKTIRVTPGPGRENISVLACVNASGRALDPLVVFKGAGNSVPMAWRGCNPLPNTYYNKSDSGWMTSSVFEKWFHVFLETTKDIRPLLLLFDGHMSHTNVEIVDLAENNDVHLLKFPPHTTDLMQSLDRACFYAQKNRCNSKSYQ